ncbi:MAG: nitrogen fixation protein [Methanobacteriaceae archaeon]|jgi:predicted Fe-Mo cluster-binding NifX family protein|nr:nitrogen fixation protein [Methanobacteriaceae archaeon]OPY20414.1 MAG: Dinitrogenase iron-molybdenum cofactor [Methanobacterium sp. PtaU1.Bin097]
MKIAVASTNGKKVDLHFADADQFLIYEIKDKEGKFKEIREKTSLTLDNHTERWIASIDLINDCKAVLCSKIGKEPTIELRKLGIKPIQLDCAVEDALSECSEHLLS